MTAAAEVATTTEAPIAARRREIVGLRPEFERAIGDPRLAERFVRVALTAIGRNPDLGECTSETLLGALLTCSVLRLEPNDPRGLAYLIPFKNNKERTTEATLVIGYKGLVDLAYRSNQIKTIAAEPVHEKDHFVEQRWPRQLVHRAADGDRGKVLRYYAAVEYKDGGQDFTVLSVDEIERHRDLYSKGHRRDDSPWKTAFDAMARKTVLRRLAKMMPLSVEDLRQFAAAVQVDGTTSTVASSGSIEDLLARDRPAIEAVDVSTSPGRVTGAEILGATSDPSAAGAPVSAAEGTTPTDPDACPACGATPSHLPSECPVAAELDATLPEATD